MAKSFIKDGVEYYHMFIGCPACVMEGRPTIRTQWNHSVDGGEMYIGDNGYYYCITCEKTMPIIDWAYECYDCKKAGHEKAVRIDNVKHVAEAIAVAGLVGTHDALKWLHRLSASLMKQTK